MVEPTDAPQSTEPSAAELNRLIGFSDAFFPIIITLLVIEIHRPEAPPGELGRALAEAWPSYAAVALAFVYVGVIWLNHHGLFRYVQRVDKGLLLINLGILGTAALIPFPTGVLAEALQSGNTQDQRAAVVLYGIFAAIMSAAWIPTFAYLEKHKDILAPEVPKGFFAAQRGRPWVGIAAYFVAIVSGLLFSPWLSVGLFAGMVFYHAWTSEGLRKPQNDSEQ